ncbi:hypothetical protein [Jeotgalibacillus campisalis]|uniref:Uncharacterized protein n=1 Tax=Jeotgalibacillus campisalis TaxID=220754 RepID=A0A0C2VVE0_9BACL|nr:hypothetical protein [Jeotgalibacillus campisalis]KIL48381.1 hypothetical protein KR50_14170 [Jeotgalibacillus campisalis]
MGRGQSIEKNVICDDTGSIVLTACQETSETSSLSFSEIEVVPEEVQEAMNGEETVQLITQEEYTYYLVFRSVKDVTANVETQDDTLIIKLDEENSQGKLLKANVYRLTVDPENEIIDIQVNGESVPIDSIAGI